MELQKIPRDALGLGLRQIHFPDLHQREKWQLDYLEIISENYMNPGALIQSRLQQAQEIGPIVLHGVGMNLLGSEPLDLEYLDRLAELASKVNAPFVSDHLCWTRKGAQYHHDLLPVPFVEDLIAYGSDRAQFVQKHLGRPFGIENLSATISFKSSTMAEWEFYTALVQESGVKYMVDVNNIFVSSVNFDFDPREYIRAIDGSQILQCHLAGHEVQDSGLIVDTHDRAVLPAVWDLYTYAWQMWGPFPTLLEWDDRIPELEVCLAELHKARQFQKDGEIAS